MAQQVEPSGQAFFRFENKSGIYVQRSHAGILPLQSSAFGINQQLNAAWGRKDKKCKGRGKIGFDIETQSQLDSAVIFIKL